LLWPLSVIYGIITFIFKFFKKPRSVDIPIICVGNAVLGGAGKTPTVLTLVSYLQQQGIIPHVIMRGHGGTVKSTHRVDVLQDDVARVGDEALLMAAHVPTWIGVNRYNSAHAAKQEGADVIIMDDGLQNHDLQTDMRLLVINGQQGFGNNFIFPAGPLRQGINGLLKTCHGVVIIDNINHNFDQAHLNNLPIWQASTQPDHNVMSQLKQQKVYAFCGLGHNEKFFTMLTRYGLNVVNTKGYSDHYPYQQNDLELMYTQAQAVGGQLVTTSKDWQRLKSEWQQKIVQIPIKLHISNHQSLINLIKISINKS